MTIHKEGYTSIALCILFIFIINAFVQFYFPAAIAVKWIVYILSFALFVIILQFFRSPKISISQDETQILCPADGKVVVIEETEETEFLMDKRIQLSVFMSPINVHINRNPMSGVIKYFKYNPGKYLVAWHPKSSTENERTTIVIENSAGVAVLFRQIAGALARRIVWYVKEGDVVEQGAQFGFIKFGSRVDVFLPLGTKINVNIGDVVKGGKTVLAELVPEVRPLNPHWHEAAPAVEPVKATMPEPAVPVQPVVTEKAPELFPADEAKAVEATPKEPKKTPAAKDESDFEKVKAARPVKTTIKKK